MHPFKDPCDHRAASLSVQQRLVLLILGILSVHVFLFFY